MAEGLGNCSASLGLQVRSQNLTGTFLTENKVPFLCVVDTCFYLSSAGTRAPLLTASMLACVLHLHNVTGTESRGESRSKREWAPPSGFMVPLSVRQGVKCWHHDL